MAQYLLAIYRDYAAPVPPERGQQVWAGVNALGDMMEEAGAHGRGTAAAWRSPGGRRTTSRPIRVRGSSRPPAAGPSTGCAAIRSVPSRTRKRTTCTVPRRSPRQAALKPQPSGRAPNPKSDDERIDRAA